MELLLSKETSISCTVPSCCSINKTIKMRVGKQSQKYDTLTILPLYLQIKLPPSHTVSTATPQISHWVFWLIILGVANLWKC